MLQHQLGACQCTRTLATSTYVSSVVSDILYGISRLLRNLLGACVYLMQNRLGGARSGTTQWVHSLISCLRTGAWAFLMFIVFSRLASVPFLLAVPSLSRQVFEWCSIGHRSVGSLPHFKSAYRHVSKVYRIFPLGQSFWPSRQLLAVPSTPSLGA